MVPFIKVLRFAGDDFRDDHIGDEFVGVIHVRAEMLDDPYLQPRLLKSFSNRCRFDGFAFLDVAGYDLPDAGLFAFGAESQ